jgi:hypothetical protein
MDASQATTSNDHPSSTVRLHDSCISGEIPGRSSVICVMTQKKTEVFCGLVMTSPKEQVRFEQKWRDM